METQEKQTAMRDRKRKKLGSEGALKVVARLDPAVRHRELIHLQSLALAAKLGILSTMARNL